MGTGNINPYKSAHLAIQGQWDAGNILTKTIRLKWRYYGGYSGGG